MAEEKINNAEEVRDEETETMARQFGIPTKKQMELINGLAKVELKPEQVFTFNAKLVGDMIIPNRYIQVHKSLLNVFKEDAKTGVALMLDHSWANFLGGQLALVYGRTFDAKLKRSDTEEEEWALFADHYLVRGKEKGGISTDSLIADISDGTAFDTSIGWGASKYECSICGGDIRKYSECEHFLGQEYDGELCYAIAKPPGFLMENSLVFDGAYPGAGVLSRLEQEHDSQFVMLDNLKNIEPDVMLFHTYSARNGKLLTFAKRDEVEVKGYTKGITLSKGGETLAENKEKETLEQQEENQEEQTQNLEQKEQGIEIYLSRDEAEEKMGCEIEPEELLRYAQEGKKYMDELVKEAEAWGVRAKGDKFNKDTWKVRFEIADSGELKAFIETFKEETENVIPAGRQSDPEANKNNESADDYPDEAFEM